MFSLSILYFQVFESCEKTIGFFEKKFTRDPETNSKFAPENMPKPNRKLVFQPSIFRCELLVSGSLDLLICQECCFPITTQVVNFAAGEAVGQWVAQNIGEKNGGVKEFSKV